MAQQYDALLVMSAIALLSQNQLLLFAASCRCGLC